MGHSPVGLFSIISAYLLGASKVIAIDQVPYRLALAAENGAIPVNFAEVPVLETLRDMTAGRGPDHCIDAVGMEARNGSTVVDTYDRVKQAVRLETERPHALREAAMSCRNGGIDPTFLITYRLSLEEAPHGYKIFKHKQDNCTKVVLQP